MREDVDACVKIYAFMSISIIRMLQGNATVYIASPPRPSLDVSVEHSNCMLKKHNLLTRDQENFWPQGLAGT